MTVGMLIESMAGKAGALHGVEQDGTPFMFSEEDRAVDYFGKQLLDAGYSYYGSENMYSGILGTELKVDIFMGVVFYQRLRHMVGDKFQSRADGAVNQLTHQPVGGRKNAGGIRFGEMERDSVIAHGAAFLLNDRLMQSSDYSKAYCCLKCGSILSPFVKKGVALCKSCDSAEHIHIVAIPFVFRYLAAEFGAFGIKCSLNVKPIGKE
jgi:DNA-directed RNA polymerase I subunit RPA2